MAMNQASTQVAPETALSSALRGLRQRCESALDRLERVNSRFSNAPRAISPGSNAQNGAVEAMTHERQIDRIEQLLNEIHSQIDTLEARI